MKSKFNIPLPSWHLHVSTRGHRWVLRRKHRHVYTPKHCHFSFFIFHCVCVCSTLLSEMDLTTMGVITQNTVQNQASKYFLQRPTYEFTFFLWIENNAKYRALVWIWHQIILLTLCFLWVEKLHKFPTIFARKPYVGFIFSTNLSDICWISEKLLLLFTTWVVALER